MIKKYVLTLPLVGVGFCLLWYPTCFAGRSPAELPGPAGFRTDSEGRVQPDEIILAENNQNAEERNPARTAQNGQAEEKPAMDNAKPSSKEKNKTKALKTFEPSEKVKADQAVDFPYDI